MINTNTSIQERTKKFAIRIIKACVWLNEQHGVCQTLSNQLLRSGTSIGANCREAQSAQSKKDFIHKLEIALKEARETQYWIEILIESEVVNSKKFQPLLKESGELVAILSASTKKLKQA